MLKLQNSRIFNLNPWNAAKGVKDLAHSRGIEEKHTPWDYMEGHRGRVLFSLLPFLFLTMLDSYYLFMQLWSYEYFSVRSPRS